MKGDLSLGDGRRQHATVEDLSIGDKTPLNEPQITLKKRFVGFLIAQISRFDPTDRRISISMVTPGRLTPQKHPKSTFNTPCKVSGLRS